MKHIRELTLGMSEEEYDNSLEQFSLEIEEERQQFCWEPDVEE